MTTYTKEIHSTKIFSQVDSVGGRAALTHESAFDRLVNRLKFSHFSLISMAILIGSCLGGITTMKIFENNAPMWQFLVGLGITMANLVACIAQAPTRWVVGLFGASLIVNAILLVINVI